MNNQLQFFAPAILIFSLMACSESGKKVSFSENEKVSIDFIKTFEGEIDNKYTIIAKIQSNSGSVSGNYYYKKVGQELELNGAISPSGEIELNEFDEYGNQTGIFNGKITNSSKIEGTWSKPNGNQSMPFVLIESNTDYLIFKKELQELKEIAGRYESPFSKGKLSMGAVIISQSKGGQFQFDITVANQEGCTGELTGKITVNPEKIGVFSSRTCKELKFEFFNQELKISEKNCEEHGINCWFSGTYKKKI